MQVLVVGATGGTGSELVTALLAAGHDVRGMVRDRAREPQVAAAGATPVHGDLEGELRPAFEGVDAVAFCAGSGSSTGADATLRVDLHGAVRTIDLCTELGIDRYVMLSSIGSRDPLQGPERMRHYLAAKHAADRILRASGLAATIVRPGGLTSEAGTGAVQVGVPELAERGSIPRADVAAVMAACLDDPASAGADFEVISGPTPIQDAVRSLGSTGR